MGNKHTIGELRQMQSLPLQAKIQMTRLRIRAWVEEFGEDGVYISFSGGKDSTVLLDIVRKDYPNIEAVFVNTGLEYPSVRQFALSKENVVELRPTMNFRDVIIKYGYPIISKEVSQVVQEARIGLKRGDGSYQFRIDRILRKGHYAPLEDGTKSQFDVSAYKFLLDAPFNISDRCCKVMKKNPARNYEKKTKRKIILGTMAEESRLRRQRWIKYGCNAWDDKKQQSSNPMSFWTENDVLTYIHTYNLSIADAYGQVVVKNDGIEGQINVHDYIGDYRDCQYETTGCKRTGCIFCGFGITQDKQRFVRLAEQEPELCDYVMRGGKFFFKVFDRKGSEIKLKHCTHKQIEKWCISNMHNRNFKIESTWQPSKDGLGYWFVLEWLNEFGKLGIGIPNRDYYMGKYCTEEIQQNMRERCGENEQS